MPARLAGRLLTSPLAFVLGGVIDTLRFLTTVAGDRWHRRRAGFPIRSDAGLSDADHPEAP